MKKNNNNEDFDDDIDCIDDVPASQYLQLNYPELAKSVGELVQEKQKAYGDSFGKAHRILQELFPNGISPDQYHDVLTLARIIDKLFRIATNKTALGESPWQDIAGYALLALARDKREN